MVQGSIEYVGFLQIRLYFITIQIFTVSYAKTIFELIKTNDKLLIVFIY